MLARSCGKSRRHAHGHPRSGARGAQIICLEELFRSQYFCREENHELFDLAEPIPGPSTEALGKLRANSSVVIVASLFERRAAGLYHNTAAVLDADGSLLGIYRKMHIPDDPLYYEKFYFTPGDLGFPNFDTQYGRIGVLICWDQWYPEGARVSACTARKFSSIPRRSAGIPPKKRNTARRNWTPGARSSARTPSPTEFSSPPSIAWVSKARPTTVRHRILGLLLRRRSFRPTDRRSRHRQEETLVVECDLRRIEEVRRNWPFLRDRRTDAYAPILERWLD